MLLFDTDRSSAAYRVRIALHLKGLDPDRHMLLTAAPAANTREAGYLGVNPHGLVPAMAVGDREILTQSLAIIAYLDELHPLPPLLPQDPLDRAHARAIALTIGCDTHPFGTTRVTDYLKDRAGFSEDDLWAWRRHWLIEGLNVAQALIARRGRGRYVVGSAPTIADICLVPQVTNAERAGLDIDRWPDISAIVRQCRTLPAFVDTAPVYDTPPRQFSSSP